MLTRSLRAKEKALKRFWENFGVYITLCFGVIPLIAGLVTIWLWGGRLFR